MTLEDWLCSTTSVSIGFVVAQPRKLFRLGAAFLRRVRDRLPTESDRSALDITEQYADGQATFRDLVEAWTQAELAGGEGIWSDGYDCDCCLGHYDPDETPYYPGALALAREPSDFVAHASRTAARLAAETFRVVAGTPEQAAYQNERCEQYWLYRDLVGDQYARAQPSPIDLAGHPDLVRLLAAIDRQESPDPLALLALADAAEEAGCADGKLLGHLRTKGAHFRGCWAVERLAGRELIRLSCDESAFVKRKRFLRGW
jgi:hypothetical protein